MKEKKGRFPEEYKRIIRESGYTVREAAHSCGVSFSRMKKFLYASAIMDAKEFKDISLFVSFFEGVE